VALVLVGAVVAGCTGGGHGAVTTTTTRPAVRRVTPAPRVASLTGLADPLGVAEHRCAVTVEVDNNLAAHPHYGLEQADVVYEEVVEGGYTRLLAVFNSQAPNRVGDVRSVRRTDQSIVWPLRGIYAYSGGAQYALDSINAATVTQLDEISAGPLMFRDPSRSAPHDLYAHVDQMYTRCADPSPPPLFTYRAARTQVAGSPVASMPVGFISGFAVTWTWDPRTNTWKRSIFGAPEITASGTQIAASNVVVMFARYAPHAGAMGAEATLTGHGTAWVFTAGKVIKGTWSRPNKVKPAEILDSARHPISLTPGRTWVEIPDLNYAMTVTR